MSLDLTSRQTDVLEYIKHYIFTESMPPTRAEIAEAFDFKSPNAAECHLRALEVKKAIRLLPGKSRGIQVIP